MKDLSLVQDIASKMLHDDSGRDQAFEFYESAYHNFWELPAQIRALPWIIKVTSSDPHDAIDSGTRILATIPVTPKFQPLGPGDLNKKRANEIEKNLMWQLQSANRRRGKKVEAEAVKSALLYDAVAMQIIDLDWQVKQKELMDLDSKREKMMRRFGRFMIKTYNPRAVHVRYSGLMPEAVLLKQLREASEILDEFGMGAADNFPWLVELAKKKEGSTVWYMDYVDFDTRSIWLQPGSHIEGDSTIGEMFADSHSEHAVLFHGDNELPFLPWVAMMGGDSMEDDPVHRYRPLLYPIYTSGAWEVQNIIESLMVSEGIAHTGSPKYKEEGPNFTQETDFEYQSPERIAKVPPGNTFQPLESPNLDRALADLDSLFAAKIDKATVSRILQGGDLPSGIAFATLNLATQTAVGVLKPAKTLSEQALAEMFTIMMLWVEFTKQDLYAYSNGGKDIGTDLVIKADEIEPEAIYIETELHPDTPTDRQQKVNTAAMAVRELYLPVTQALEEIGVADPESAIKQSLKERQLQHLQDMEFRRDQAMLDMEIQRMQLQMQQEQQQQSQMLQQGVGEGAPGGQGFNPAEGGQPPATANPNLTRETVSGLDFMGNPTENVNLAAGGLF